MTAPKILVCTVGGSNAPILTAVRARAWDYVVFICTDDSVAMVAEQATKPERTTAAVRQPSIPAQTGLALGSWSTLIVPADNPGQIYARLTEQFETLRATHDHAEITVDYTGGTKSMSAAAVLAVALRTGIQLQLTSGQRSDLVRVVDGTQQAIGLATDRIVLDRQIEVLRTIWHQYGYQEAADGFAELVSTANNHHDISPDLSVRLKFWHRLSLAFAAWDRFDRNLTVGELRQQSRKGTNELKRFAELARTLQNSNRGGAPTSLVLFDLLRNAERCAARGRHDDAVARCSRLWEWTVQWLLQTESGIVTGDVDGNRLPPDIREGLNPKKNGRFEIPSAKAWALYRHLHPGSGATLFWTEVDGSGRTNAEHYRHNSDIRNQSILAHGSRPIDQNDSKKILGWTTGPFMDMLRAEARRLNQPDDMPQLPTDLPGIVAAAGPDTTSL
jgi:CRISPR-associated protein (TIGR02710 family)